MAKTATAQKQPTQDDYNREAVTNRREFIREATDAATTFVRNERDKYDAEARRREHDGGMAPPRSQRPAAGMPKWCRKVVKKLGTDIDSWIRHEDLVAALHDEDLVGETIDRLLDECEEFEGLCASRTNMQIRWSSSAMIRRDGALEEVILGRAKAIPLAERETWPDTDGPAPLWRLDLSLPVLLLAEGDELEPLIHGLLSQLGLGANGPYIRKPDLVGYSANLGRYGVRTAREVQALAHAMGHTDTAARLRRHNYDPATGQGLLWAPRAAAGEFGGEWH